MHWTIRYRAKNGVAFATYSTITREEAEDAFHFDMLEADAFGVIISVTPSSGMDAKDQGGAPPTA